MDPIFPAWIEQALIDLNFPNAGVCAVFIIVSAAVSLRMTQDIKASAPRGIVDDWRWQMTWRLVPGVLGAFVAVTVALVGTTEPLPAAILGAIGGLLAVPLWHVAKDRFPSLFK